MSSLADTQVSLHATALIVGEAALLIRGASGTGKTTLALQLIDTAQRRGQFARLIGDDRVSLRRAGGRLIVAPHPAIAGMVEKRWQGVEAEPHEPKAVVGAVIDLVDVGRDPLPRLPQQAERLAILAKLSVPRLALPVRLGFAAQTMRILDFAAAHSAVKSHNKPALDPC